MTQLKKELSELEAGTHATLCANLKALEHERDQRLFRINTIAQMRVKYVDNQYELERSMAQEDLDVCLGYVFVWCKGHHAYMTTLDRQTTSEECMESIRWRQEW